MDGCSFIENIDALFFYMQELILELDKEDIVEHEDEEIIKHVAIITLVREVPM